MSQYRPAIDDLLASVREALDQLVPQLDGEARYQAQVAAHLVGICERELGTGESHPKADATVWAGLLGKAGGEPGPLARELCAAIRAGRLDDRFDAVVEAVLARTIDDVRVVRPRHLERSGPAGRQP
ncbi:DUF6285 domain-containing protein [Chelatococcus reniformis]|uniref:DUF6285 domain-containing protein n=1 Tax=Chelatococcus reniformis TaxID=1494448 RepID=A0A916X8U8_9HYPH|nr:DUF6285 domain-containing protein [Chelatococcus reniformis]GGC52894.1 hypothetical protein GCM10010994_10010 [Chelatococcus reniformis]